MTGFTLMQNVTAGKINLFISEAVGTLRPVGDSGNYLKKKNFWILQFPILEENFSHHMAT